MVGQIAFKQSTTNRLTTAKQYDNLNRLSSIGSVPAADSALVYAYQYNEANQRIRVNLADGAYWLYRYDSLGQVISGKKYFADNTPVPGQQFEYGFDDIGNRLSTKAGGDQNGANLRSASYTPNLLNQIATRGVPGGFDVVGLAPVAASATVNSSSVDYRRGEYYQELLSPVNTSVSVWQSVAVTTSGGGSTSGNVYVPKTPENFSYDTDGNQTVDGRWNYTWDAENRLIRMVANTAVGPQQRIDYGYDAKGRRISKKVWSNTAGTGSPATYNRFIYDGWNLLAELDGNNTNAVVRSYIWGSDLSGSMQGAGGVGGLLMINDPTTVATHFVAYDGNGNVVATVSGSAGTTTATYEYGPFGEVIRSSGTISKTNPYRFSTKYQDNETDLLYYGYRYYSQSSGRWISRDPMAELGGLNLYAFVLNRPTIGFDPDGRVAVVDDAVIIAAIGTAVACSAATAWLTSPEGQKAIHDIAETAISAADAIWDAISAAAGKCKDFICSRKKANCDPIEGLSVAQDESKYGKSKCPPPVAWQAQGSGGGHGQGGSTHWHWIAWDPAPCGLCIPTRRSGPNPPANAVILPGVYK